jgi:pilus assembly protein Flp/PilA
MCASARTPTLADVEGLRHQEGAVPPNSAGRGPEGRESQMPQLVATIRFTASWLTARLNVKSERGATAVEYGLMVALIAAVIIGAVVALGNNAKSTFDCTSSSIAAKANQC